MNVAFANETDFHAFGVDRNDLVRFVAYETFGQRMLIGRSTTYGLPQFSPAPAYADPYCWDCGFWPSVAIDPQNNVHVAYAGHSAPGAPAGKSVKYLYETQTGVQSIETIENMLSDFGPTSIAVEANGRVHVAYVANGALRYALKLPSGWELQSISDAGSMMTVGIFGSTPQFAASTPSNLLHLSLGGGVLSSTPLESASSATPFSSSIAIDTNGNALIAYVHPTVRDLRLASLDGGVWVSEVVDPLVSLGSVMLRVSKQNVPHISFLGATGRPRYAVRPGTTWQLKDLDPGNAKNVSLALDQYGAPHVMFYDGSRLKYVH